MRETPVVSASLWRRIATAAFPAAGRITLLATDRSPLVIAVVGTIGALLLAVLTRGLLVHQPLYDELLHVLAAHGMLASGEPTIRDGVYDRAVLFTEAVSWSLRWFGDTLVAARIPAWLSAIALAALVGGWTTRRAGALAGLAAAAFFAVHPRTLDYAVFARFYTLHALLVAVMFIALYESFARERRTAVRAVFVAIAFVAGWIAWHLQITTLIAIGGAVTGLAAVLVLDNGPAVVRFVRARPLLSAGGALIAVTALAIYCVQAGLIERLGTAPLWGAHRANSLEYYNWVQSRDLPLLWPLFPLAAVTTYLVDRRLAVFCTVTTLACLFVHSIAAQKDPRYIYYLAPLLCVLWGVAAARVVEVLPAFLARAMPFARGLAPLLAVAFLAFAAINSHEGREAVRLLLGRDNAATALSYSGEADWSAAVDVLSEARTRARALVTSNSMKAIHYLGDYDIELNASIVEETDTGQEFGRDPRTGRVAIGTVDSMRQVLEGEPPVLVIVEREKLGQRTGVPAEVIALLDGECTPLALPAAAGLVAWMCEPSAAERQNTSLTANGTPHGEQASASTDSGATAADAGGAAVPAALRPDP